MKTIILNLKDHQYRKLAERAARAQLPLERYIIAAASEPLRYAWPDEIPLSEELKT